MTEKEVIKIMNELNKKLIILPDILPSERMWVISDGNGKPDPEYLSEEDRSTIEQHELKKI